MPLREIVVQGAREHNLKGVDLRLPRGSLTTITGVSGSGKSSLAFDTIFQEGQRRFVESLSSYARQFLGNVEKPRVDHVEGLSPTISIDQKTVNRNPRSTVGTITEIFDHLRLLFARLGTPHCTGCDRELTAQTKDQIADRLVASSEGKRLQVLAPVIQGRKGEYRKELEQLRLKGFVRARVDGEERRLDEEIKLSRYVKHTIEVVVDRLVGAKDKAGRVAEAVEQALKLTNGVVAALIDDQHVEFSAKRSCSACGTDFPDLEPRLFSFNSPFGACPECNGLGLRRTFDAALLIEDENLSIAQGALKAMTKTGYLAYARLGPESLKRVAQHFGFTLDQPWKTLTRKQKDVLIHGSGDEKVRLRWEYETEDGRTVKGEDHRPVEGVLPAMEKFWRMTKSPHVEKFMATTTCSACAGTRLRPEARSVRFRDRTITDLAATTIGDLDERLRTVKLSVREELVGRQVMKEIRTRLQFLVDVGLSYLPLDRGAATLSGGEAQRVRLATQVGAHLQGVLYVLDEPSIGLHQRDNHRLIETLRQLRDRGNTVLVVEHDRDTMLASDVLVDVGPGAGREGGEIVAVGTPAKVWRSPTSITARYLRGERTIDAPATRRKGSGAKLVVRGARQHNLKGIDVAIPLGCFVAVTGVSGSGKSTLVDLVLKRALAAELHGAREPVGAHDAIDGLEHVDKVIEIDQSPIGRTPRSNPATYTGAMDLIRDLFAGQPEAKVRGYAKGRFSFNVPGGRCEECEGAGVKLVEMSFLADVEIPCDACAGRRYNRETLEIAYKDKSIRDVLEFTIAEAAEFFAAVPPLARILDTLLGVGLGYMALGQTATTLSGGEAQRLKLATELARPGTGKTLYLLDEPTTGLHFADIEKLIGALQQLVERGNTVVVIEHNLDVVKVADWVLDLGPEGGKGGGELVFAGTPEQIVKSKRSLTGRELAAYLAPLAPPVDGVVRESDVDDGRALRVFGATCHNLKSVDVEIPHGKLTVVTGLSGSGKTSLAFDTIFAEAQRRFVESMSTYARRFLARMDKAPVDRIEGLAPAIAIDRKAGSKNPRSTVATSTEIHDYLRVLFARVGTAHCPQCRAPLRAQAPSMAAAGVLDAHKGKRVRVLAPLWRAESKVALPHATAAAALCAFDELRKAGFARVAIDGVELRLDEVGPKPPRAQHSVDLVIDRLALKGEERARVSDAIEQAYARTHGLCVVRDEAGAETWVTQKPQCPTHGEAQDGELHPRLFSFNSHLGACPSCDGIGLAQRLDLGALLVRPDKPFTAGALAPPWDVDLAKSYFELMPVFQALSKAMDFSLKTPFAKLPQAARDALLFGYEPLLSIHLVRASRTSKREMRFEQVWPGLVPYFEAKFKNSADGKWWRTRLLPLMREGVCPACSGGRLNPFASAVGVADRTLPDLSRLSVRDALAWFRQLTLTGGAAKVAAELTREVVNRLQVLEDVGVGYLTLDRTSATLSGGEAQRIRLATQLGNRLVGVLYVLDEPTIGLHPRDTRRLLATLAGLRDLGNTIVVVEHDLDVIRAADHVIDVGPGAGVRGGTIVASGDVAAIERHPDSITGLYLRGERRIALPKQRRVQDRGAIELVGARLHNLKGVDVTLPLGCLTVVTGVSGSGKSTLVMDVLEPALRLRLAGEMRGGEPFTRIGVPKSIHEMIVVDQSALGPTPASNPATYTGVFDRVRAIFASTPEARMKGFTAKRFSFNQAGGRCAACEGKGFVQIEMHFLSDVYVPCEICDGKRFDRETLAVTYGGKSIAEVLDLEVDAALEFFQNHRAIQRTMQLLHDVGLGYLRLGQPATQLSGGEAQRVKLAAELGKAQQGSTLYLLDEPTTGLHVDDTARLLEVLSRLVDAGNTVVVIEHNPEVIRCADWIVDMGPGGGEEGGRVLVQGTPEAVAKCPTSETGRFLKRDLKLARKAGETTA
ncbi:MAG: excinuclease ABC subunit UvrA [Planctomycetes bacterium]|nr:excinuclease ABC subunit UvrA [Planctomycetota bacterium]MCC7171036.1 excinuclease ABC subunit UvrA [Planctomycetota bacterium]